MIQRLDEDRSFRDPLTRRSLAPARWLASAPHAPWSLRRAAARFHIRASRKELHGVRKIAVDHSRRLSAAEPRDGVGPIWQFWAQGADAAPPMVKACLRSVRRHRGDRDLIVLNDKTLDSHIDLPGHVWDKRGLMGHPHFSNFIRLALLQAHGGTWIDATILLSQPVPDEVEREPFFIFRETTREARWVETWFMHARQNHPLVETVLMGLADYWKTYDRLHEYFMFPYHFEAALVLHSRLRRDFLDMPQFAANQPHKLQWQLMQPFHQNNHRTLFYKSWLHKLTYKYQRPDVAEHLLCDAIIGGWADGLHAGETPLADTGV
jgi:hypothetical protein